MLVAYDGSGFHGFADQPGQRTVAGVLTDAIERVVRHPIELTCAGRTDRGVHAWGQVVSLDLSADGVDLDVLHRSLVKLCGPDIVVREVDRGGPGLRRPVLGHGPHLPLHRPEPPVPDPFLARTTWHVTEPLDLELLTLACDPFLGEHDFSAFCRRPKGPEGRSRCRWSGGCVEPAGTDLGDGLLRFEITANAFCHQMVRSIVGTMVAAGRRQVRAGDIRGILRAGDRAAAAPIAPPEGLCLWHVDYDGLTTESCGRALRGRSFALRLGRPRARQRSSSTSQGRFRVRTYSPKASEITRKWFVIDARGPRPRPSLDRGRPHLARQAQARLRAALDMGDHVIVINAEKVVLTANKAEQKMVYRHSGYPGGLKSRTFADAEARKPEEAVRRVIRGCSPRTASVARCSRS